LGITIAVAATIFGKSFIDGEFIPIIQNISDMETGHIKIVRREYKEKERMMPVNYNFNFIELENKISKIKDVKLLRPRIKFGTLIAKGDNEADGVIGFSILPEREKDFVLLKGKTLNRGEILVSKKFADKFKINRNDTLVLITQTVYGYLNGISLLVKDFYETDIEYIASNIVFLHINDAQRLLAMDSTKAIELLVYCKDLGSSLKVSKEIKSFLSDDYFLSNWQEGESILSLLKVSFSVMTLVFLVMFFLASIAIINTLVMSLYERKKEIGMMKALGLKSGKIFLIFFLETTIIGFIGTFLGIIFGVTITYIFSKVGFDYSNALKNIQIPIKPIIYPVLSITNIILGFALGIVTSSLSSLFLLKRVKVVNPVEILRE
jgi:putative ABC transport system permease protein